MKVTINGVVYEITVTDAGLTTNITYVGLEASEVTVQVTYNNGASTETVTSGQTIYNIGGQNVSVSVTSTKGIGTTVLFESVNNRDKNYNS